MLKLSPEQTLKSTQPSLKTMARKPTSERFKTREGVFDAFTLRNLFVLASKGYFDDDTLIPVNRGKESAVFQATRGEEQVAIKIYFLSNANFNTMYSYIRVDPRFTHVKQRRRDIIFAWCRREFKNLAVTHKLGLNVPKPIGFKNNILVMSLIGEPARKLNQDTPKAPALFYKETIEQMRLLHKKNMVHGDLSAFNMLNHEQHPYLIDFSHTQPLNAPRAQELLERDCKNVATYFQKLGVDTSEKDILAYLTK